MEAIVIQLYVIAQTIVHVTRNEIFYLQNFV